MFLDFLSSTIGAQPLLRIPIKQFEYQVPSERRQVGGQVEGRVLDVVEELVSIGRG